MVVICLYPSKTFISLFLHIYKRGNILQENIKLKQVQIVSVLIFIQTPDYINTLDRSSFAGVAQNTQITQFTQIKKAWLQCCASRIQKESVTPQLNLIN